MTIKECLKPIKYHSNCYITTKQFKLRDITIPKNTIAYYAQNEGVIYFCAHFPRYNGKVQNIFLRVAYFDFAMRQVNECVIQNCVASVSLVNAWKSASMPHAQKPQQTINLNSMMQDCIRRKKSGSGGVRLSAKSDEYTTDSLRYKQVTEPAYWASIGIGYNGRPCTNSGNASVTASNIR